MRSKVNILSWLLFLVSTVVNIVLLVFIFEMVKEIESLFVEILIATMYVLVISTSQIYKKLRNR